MLNSSTVPRYANHATHLLDTFDLSGFNGSPNISIVSPIFPCWTANSSRITPKLWVFLLKTLKN
jgi:hypothetical protein